MNSRTLAQLPPGQLATVTKIAGNGPVRRRLMDMGLVPGVEVEAIKTAPLGDPVEYVVLGYHLALRKTEADLIEID
jgi:ferrous iron transport protein A